MVPRLAAAPDAAEGGGVAVKQPQIAIGAGPVKLLVEVMRPRERALHLANEFERAQPSGSCQLPEVHAEVVMRRRRVGLARDRLLGGGNSLFRQGSAFRLVRGELGKVKTGPCEFPGSRRLARRVPVVCLRFLEVLLRVSDEPRFGGKWICQGWMGLREKAQANREHNHCP